MKPCSENFLKDSAKSLKKPNLQQALGLIKVFGPAGRGSAISELDDYESFTKYAIRRRQHGLDHMAHYLDEFEENLTKNGGQLHWAKTTDDMNNAVLAILEKHKAKAIVKGKSMISEETEMNVALEKNGYSVTETDLGEYIIQIADEPPSHITGPAIHKTKEEVATLFKEHHDLGERNLDGIPELVKEGRKMVRDKFLEADVGIIGANLLIAETGQTVLVTNEGNGDLSSTLPKVQIVVTSIEKIVATFDDAASILRLLVRNAIGQTTTAYTSFYSGPKRDGDLDGPDEMHVILLDNGRSDIINGPYRDMLRCIKCAACLNHCPIYTAVGGHAYGWIYQGPMGSVLGPLLNGLEKTTPLPNACTTCGRCKEVCPMDIPLPEMLHQLRTEAHEKRYNDWASRIFIFKFMFLARHPSLYRLTEKMGNWALSTKLIRAIVGKLPFFSGWTKGRALPVPEGGTFLDQWKKQTSKGKRHD